MQLGTRVNEGLGDLLGQVDYPLGIIAGDRAVDPLGWLLIPGPNDGKVSVNRTKVRGMSDHVTLHATHALMMRNVHVIQHTIHFLRHGRFPEKQQRGQREQHQQDQRERPDLKPGHRPGREVPLGRPRRQVFVRTPAVVSDAVRPPDAARRGSASGA